MPTITVETTVHKNINLVWDCWTKPEHITKWNFASPEWHCPSAKIDLKVGGEMNSRMEAKKGNMIFTKKFNQSLLFFLLLTLFVMLIKWPLSKIDSDSRWLYYLILYPLNMALNSLVFW